MPIAQPATIDWKRLIPALIAPTGTHKGTTLRPMQTRGYNLLKDATRSIISAPTGSGKTLLTLCLQYNWLKQRPQSKGLIVVPQLIIGKGFNSGLLPEECDNYTLIPLDLTDDMAKNTTAELGAYLTSKPLRTDVSSRTCICTHATFAATVKQLVKANRFDEIVDLFLWVDEGHHVSSSSDNQLGNILQVFDRDARHIIGLSTATFHRTDQSPILACTKDWTMFEYPLFQYLADTKHLESFQYRFEVYQTSPLEVIASHYAQHETPSLVYLPFVNTHHWCSDRGLPLTKYQQIAALEKALHRANCAPLKVKPAKKGIPLYHIPQHNEDEDDDTPPLRILNLVEEKNRKAGYNYLYNHPEEIDVVIALNVMKEGGNWLPVQRAYIIGDRKSLVEIIQILGRLLRDCPGKPHVEIIHLLRWDINGLDPEATAERKAEIKGGLNSYINTILAVVSIGANFNASAKDLHGVSIPTLQKLFRTMLHAFVKHKPRTRDEAKKLVKSLAGPGKSAALIDSATDFLLTQMQGQFDLPNLEMLFESISQYALQYISPVQNSESLEALSDLFQGDFMSSQKYWDWMRDKRITNSQQFDKHRKASDLNLPAKPEIAYAAMGLEFFNVLVQILGKNKKLTSGWSHLWAENIAKFEPFLRFHACVGRNINFPPFTLWFHEQQKKPRYKLHSDRWPTIQPFISPTKGQRRDHVTWLKRNLKGIPLEDYLSYNTWKRLPREDQFTQETFLRVLAPHIDKLS
jgi:hypothetical protein